MFIKLKMHLFKHHLILFIILNTIMNLTLFLILMKVI